MEKVAVIGLGAMGKNHVRVYSQMDNVELVSISDVDEKRVSQFSGKYKIRGYTDYKEMLEKEELDIVSVVVPTKLHKQISLDVIAKGINILIEKPIAFTVEEAEEIIKVAKNKGVKLTVGHVERFNPAITELKKRLDKKELGRLFKIDINRVGPLPSRIRDVGVVIDLATHDLDIIRYLLGVDAERIYAETENKINTEHEDLLSAILRFKDGSVCNLNINWLTPTKIRKLYLTGEKGMFVVDYIKQTLVFFENGEIKNGPTYTEIVRGIAEGKMIRYKIQNKEPLELELQSFIDCVKNNKEPVVSGEDGLRALSTAQKIIESASTNKVISL